MQAVPDGFDVPRALADDTALQLFHFSRHRRQLWKVGAFAPPDKPFLGFDAADDESAIPFGAGIPGKRITSGILEPQEERLNFDDLQAWAFCGGDRARLIQHRIGLKSGPGADGAGATPDDNARPE